MSEVSRVGVRACRASEIFSDAASADLIAEYERECANPLLGACAPQQAIYAALEERGFARCFAAYRGNELCGFAFVLTAAVPHYEGKFARVESLFVASAARGSNLGRELMEALEGSCREAGCAAVCYSAPAGSRLARLLSLSSDYMNTNLLFCRSLK